MKKKCGVLFWYIGILIALVGGFVMWHGSLFGERNSGIAIVIGIIGIGLIATSNPGFAIKRK